MEGKILKRDAIEDGLDIESRLELDDAILVNVPQSDSKIQTPTDLKEQKKAQNLVGVALEEARAVKERAKALYQSIDQKMREARQQGYDEGYREGLREATELQVRLKLENEKIFKTLERDMLELVFEIAHKVIGDAFRASDDALLGMIRQAMQSSMGNKLVVLVNSSDFERVKQHEMQLMGILHASQSLMIRPSETVTPGSCVIESELGTIEALLEDQLAAIKKAVENFDSGGGM